MKRKLLISISVLVLLPATVLYSHGKTRVTVSTSVSLAGVIGGGIYWYVSVGTRVSKKDSDIKVALLGGDKFNLNSYTDSDRMSVNRHDLYLPLYRMTF